MRVREPCVALSPSLSLSFHEIAENCAFDTIKLKCVRHYLVAPLPPALWPPPHPYHNWKLICAQQITVAKIFLSLCSARHEASQSVSHVGRRLVSCPRQPATTTTINLLLPINLSRTIFKHTPLHRTLTRPTTTHLSRPLPFPGISISRRFGCCIIKTTRGPDKKQKKKLLLICFYCDLCRRRERHQRAAKREREEGERDCRACKMWSN